MAEMKKNARPPMPLPNAKKIPSPPTHKPQLKKSVAVPTKSKPLVPSFKPKPKAPMIPDKILGVSPDDRKYATVIASVIINCNSALKQYKKVVPKEKVNSEKNKEQIIYAVLTCKNLKLLKKTYKNSREFLMNADIDIFHDNKTPKDVTTSLNVIIDKLKKEKRTSNLSSMEKTYLEDAHKFIEMKSQFPNRVRNLNDICRFVEKNIKVLSETYPKFKEIRDDKIYKFLKDSSLSTFEKFQQKFIDVFEIAYKEELKPVKTNALKRY